MIVAITGGTGFIGKRLALYCLSRGDDVRVLSRRQPDRTWHSHNVKWYQGGLEDRACLSSFIDGVDVLYHCAGQITELNKMRGLHVNGTQNLIDAASGRIGHWVQLSSVGVYGSILNGMITEDSPIKPIGEYEITKAESDEIVLAAANLGKFSCTVLRPSNVFGDEMSNQSLFAMINAINRGLFFFIGKPGASANYIHVDNVVEALLRCGTLPAAKGGIYNLSDHCAMESLVEVIVAELKCHKPWLRLPELSVRWLAQLMGFIPGFPLSPSRVDALTNHSIYAIDRIQNELDYEHIISMQQGLQQLVAAFKNREQVSK